MSTIVNTIDANLAARLRHERLARNWSMAELAERAGVSRAMIAKVEAGKASPTAALLGRLSGAFGLSLSTLLARAEGAAGRHVRRADQPVWSDPKTGYVRRAVSAPNARGAEVVEVTLPPGARIAFPAASYAFFVQQMLVTAGELRFTEGDVAHRLAEGDWLELGEPRDCVFETAGTQPCTYLVILVKS